MQTEDSQLTPKYWSEGIITTLFKKGDRANLKDYRPLFLLNSVYKFVTGLINNRLLEPVSELIGVHQKGFLPGRQNFDNIKEAQCLMNRATVILLIIFPRIIALRRLFGPRKDFVSFYSVDGTASFFSIGGTLCVVVLFRLEP